MNTPFTPWFTPWWAPWISLTLHQAQRGHHLAWFLYGWFERERRLDLEACVAWWMRGAAPCPNRSAIPAAARRAPAWAAGSTMASADSTRPMPARR